MQILGARLCETVGERLDHDRAVVVVLGFEPAGELVAAETGGDRERADVVTTRGDVVGEAAVGPGVAVIRLLPQETEADLVAMDSVVILDNDIVAVGRRGPEAVDAPRGEQPVADNLVEQLLRVVVQLARSRLLEDRRVAPLELPRVEEELPVDVLEGRLEHPHAGERGHRQLVERDALVVRARGVDGK